MSGQITKFSFCGDLQMVLGEHGIGWLPGKLSQTEDGLNIDFEALPLDKKDGMTQSEQSLIHHEGVARSDSRSSIADKPTHPLWEAAVASQDDFAAFGSVSSDAFSREKTLPEVYRALQAIINGVAVRFESMHSPEREIDRFVSGQSNAQGISAKVYLAALQLFSTQFERRWHGEEILFGLVDQIKHPDAKAMVHDLATVSRFQVTMSDRQQVGGRYAQCQEKSAELWSNALTTEVDPLLDPIRIYQGVLAGALAARYESQVAYGGGVDVSRLLRRGSKVFLPRGQRVAGEYELRMLLNSVGGLFFGGRWYEIVEGIHTVSVTRLKGSGDTKLVEDLGPLQEAAGRFAWG